jgi:hypothetical protein
VQVQRVAGGVVVVRVVHAPGHGGVVVAQDGVRGAGADERAALVGAGPVAHGVAQTDPLIDAFRIDRLEDHLQGFDVGVRV